MNSLLETLPIISSQLIDLYGFECKTDYDKDFDDDEYFSLQLNTYSKKIVGELNIQVTDTFKFNSTTKFFDYQSTIVEIVIGAEYQEIKIDKMWQLLMLIDMLEGKNNIKND